MSCVTLSIICNPFHPCKKEYIFFQITELGRILTNARWVSVSFRSFIPRSITSFSTFKGRKIKSLYFFRCLIIEVKISGERLFLPIIFLGFSGVSSDLHCLAEYSYPIAPFHHGLKSQHLTFSPLLMEFVTAVDFNCFSKIKDN